MWGEMVNKKSWSRIDSVLGLVKTCSKCNIEKPASEYWKAKNQPDGLYSSCKECANKTWRDYYHSERGNITQKIKSKRYYSENRVKTRARHDANTFIFKFKKRGGTCLICFSINPFTLTEHHYFGKKISDNVIALCENCHELADNYPFLLEKRIGKNLEVFF